MIVALVLKTRLDRFSYNGVSCDQPLLPILILDPKILDLYLATARLQTLAGTVIMV